MGSVLDSVVFLYPTPCLSPLSSLLAVVLGSVVELCVLCLSIAFVMVINLTCLLMPFLVPTSLLNWAFLPIPTVLFGNFPHLHSSKTNVFIGLEIKILL